MDHNVGLGFVSDVSVIFMAPNVIFFFLEMKYNIHILFPEDTSCCVLFIDIEVSPSR